MFMREGQQIHRSSHALVDDHADARQRRQQRRAAVRRAEGRGLRRVRPYRRPLCRHQNGARRADRALGRGAFRLGHLRVAAARRAGTGLPRRHPRQLRRPQGPARREPSGRVAVRRLWRAVLSSRARAHPRRAVRRAAPAPSLRDDRLPPGARRAGALRRATPSSTPTIPQLGPTTSRAGRARR